MENPTNSAPAAGSAPAAAAPSSPAPVAPAPAAAPVATPAKPDVKSVVASMTSEQRRQLAIGKVSEIKPTAAQTAAAKPAPAAKPEPTPAPVVETPAPAAGAPAQEPVVTTPAAETVNPAPEAAQSNPEGSNPEVQPEAGEGEKDNGRIRLHGEDYAIAVLAKNKGISILEASRLYAGDNPAPAPAQVPAQPATPAVDPKVTEYETRISEAKTKIQSVQAAYKEAAENMDSGKMADLVTELTSLQTDVRFLSNEKEGYVLNQRQTVQQNYESQVERSRDRVIGEFPELADVNSRERMAFDTYVDRAINDPKRKAEFMDPTWPEKLTREYAQKFGLKPKSAAAAPAAHQVPPAKPAAITRTQPQQVPPTAQAGAKSLTGNDGRTPSAPSPRTREQVLEMVRNDPAARRTIMQNFKQLTPSGRR